MFEYSNKFIIDKKKILFLDLEHINDVEDMTEQYRFTIIKSDVLLIRYDILKSTHLTNDIIKKIDYFFKRSNGIDIFLIHSERFKIKIYKILGEGKKELVDDGILIKNIQQVELSTILKSSNAIYGRTPPGTYIKTPSGKISDTFVRAGNVQRDIHILDIFFFWLIPHLKNVDSIILDTWTISSIALNISRRLPEYLGKYKKSNYVDVLSEYYGDDPSSQEQLGKIVGNMQRYNLRNPLFLYSICATGKSIVKLINDLSNHVSIKSSKFIPLYSFSKHISNKKLIALCVIDSAIEPKYAKIENVKNDNVLTIDPNSYVPNIFESVNEVRSTNIRSSLIEDSKFFSLYAGSNSVQTHRSSYDKLNKKIRHYSVYVDVLSLLDHPAFIRKLQKKIGLFNIDTVPLLIITPNYHSCMRFSEEIANFFCKIFHLCPPIYNQTHITNDSNLINTLKTLSENDHILVVDDVCISGSRISEYQGQLRDNGFKGKTSYLIGVLRPESEEIHDELKFREWNNIDEKYTDKVEFIEKIILPNWREQQCPWCIEKNILKKWAGFLKLDSETEKIIQQRVDVLENSEKLGMVDNCFLHPIGMVSNSLFVSGGERVSQADIIGSVASTIQTFRTKGISGNRLGSFYPKRVILSDIDMYQSNWQNAVIQLSIWRMSKSYELQSVDHEINIGRLEKLGECLNGMESTEDRESLNLKSKIYEIGLNILKQKLEVPIDGLSINKSWEDFLEAKFLSAVQRSTVR